MRGRAGRSSGLSSASNGGSTGGPTSRAEIVGDGLYRLTVRVENRTRLEAGPPMTATGRCCRRSSRRIRSSASRNGEFVSLIDPPEPLRSLAAACSNVGTWPVLVGAAGQTDTMLSSPIILYDYPQIAPESPGDLFDATEIDEILTLRILTLTDDEKRAMAALDGRGKALLERTEALAREQLMGLHGTFRGLQPVDESGRPHHG